MIFNPVFRDAQALGKQLASQSWLGAQAGHDFLLGSFLGSFLGNGLPFIFLLQKCEWAQTLIIDQCKLLYDIKVLLTTFAYFSSLYVTSGTPIKL
jgi:hypothetical protein